MALPKTDALFFDSPSRFSNSTLKLLMLHRGTGSRGLETAHPKSPSWLTRSPQGAECQPQSPPIADYLPISERLPSSKECVVADAVAIEPVSAPQFPANREKNREFCNFGTISRIRSAQEARDFRAFRPNSLLKGTGNFWRENREFVTAIREFPRP